MKPFSILRRAFMGIIVTVTDGIWYLGRGRTASAAVVYMLGAVRTSLGEGRITNQQARSQTEESWKNQSHKRDFLELSQGIHLCLF
jgi:hypothetical protein